MNPEQISRRYDSAIVVRRWLGAWVDFLVLLLIFTIPDFISHEFYVKSLPLWVVLAIAYFPALESTSGRTVGKYASGTIVVDAEGNIPNFGRSLVRTLLRIVEVNPLFAGGVPAGIVTALTKTHQRLGDLAAGTFVIRAKDRALLSEFLTYVPEELLASKKRAPWAVAAGYLGLFSVLGFPGPFAILAGILGLRQLKFNPEFGGKAGAIFGIIAGSLGTGGLILVLRA